MSLYVVIVLSLIANILLMMILWISVGYFAAQVRILRLLNSGAWMHGREIRKGARVPIGLVYHALHNLEDQGLIESRDDPPEVHEQTQEYYIQVYGSGGEERPEAIPRKQYRRSKPKVTEIQP